MKKKNLPFYLSISAIFIGIVAANLFSDGMFMDGLMYATIARNMAVGIGSFWELQLSETLFKQFYEHPPLAMGLQSVFFRIFGDSIYVERFYSLATYFLTAWLIVLVWRKSVESDKKSLAWLAVLFWLIIPLNIWAVSNNMLENTMMVFTTLSVFFMMLSVEKKRLLFIGIAGLSVFLAFLTKGFTALFTFSFFFWAFIFNKINFTRFIIDSFLLLFFSALPAALVVLFSNEALESIITYLNIQVVNSLNNVETVDSRLFIIIRLLKEMIPTMALFIIIVLLLKTSFKKLFRNKRWNYSPFFFLALGLSGVIPIMVSMKQSGFYILATFPYFAIFFALLLAHPLNNWYQSISTQQKAFKIFRFGSFLLLLLSIGISVSQINRIGRDKKMLKDIYAVSKIVPHESKISILPEMRFNWSLHAYFYRYAFISLDADTSNLKQYMLVEANSEAIPSQYKLAPLELEMFKLYLRENTN